MGEAGLAVIGNCQAPGFATCLEALLPGANVEVFLLGHLRKDPPEEQQRTAEAIAAHEIVFTQPSEGDELGPLKTSALAEIASRLVTFPAISFAGFHPDSLYVESHGKRLLSPIGHYNSGLVASAFLEGVPEDRVPGLFNTYFFARMGYFDRYAQAERFLVDRSAEDGYDLRGALSEWRRRGVFMHSHNHPKVAVLLTLARMALERAGMAVPGASVDPESLSDDLSAGARWPVYPELARRLELESAGTTVFEKSERLAGADGRAVPLEQFVRGSYESYRAGALAEAPEKNDRIERGRKAIRAANVR